MGDAQKLKKAENDVNKQLTLIFSRHTHHNSAKPKSNHKPTTGPTEYLHQYSADEGV
jgi:hypothetical protein